ncbi:MAG: SRPBCC family protein [Steroidobacteraceae bacterium]
MKAQSDSPDPLVFECDFDEPPEKVWRALTEPQLLEAWLAAEDSSSTGESATRAGSKDYAILTAEPHRLLRYRWRDRESGVGGSGDSDGREIHSIVTVELVPGPAGGTHLRLTHGEFRIVTAASTAARVRPITSARRRRAPILSCAVQPYLRRAA